MEISFVLPPSSDSAIDFDLMDCVTAGLEINMIEDYELTITDQPVNVFELIGKSQITFFTDSSRPYLAFNIKLMKRFLTVVLKCIDDEGTERYFYMSNKTSIITIDKNVCHLPLSINDGWQYVCIELDELMANAFGTSLISCREITVTGTCRLSKIYFQSKKYSDIELPKFLRLIK
jgi:hypothetical protein